MNNRLSSPGSNPKPTLAFCGVGWIGKRRLKAVLESDLAKVLVIADPSAVCRIEALELAQQAELYDEWEEAVNHPSVDGVVISTPNFLHKTQTIAALEKGKSVFCQYPPGCSSAEVETMIDAARKADRLLATDFSYRYCEAFQQTGDIIGSGELGTLFAVELSFHSAMGPENEWYYQIGQSGGGCMMDLGMHLLDFALLALGFPDVTRVESRLYAKGKRIEGRTQAEDYGTALVDLANGIQLTITSSWHLHIGSPATIRAGFYGTRGAVSLQNINGSFFDFAAFLHKGTSRQWLSGTPEDWTGRAILNWIRQLSINPRYDPMAEKYINSARLIDRIYEQAM
jgi:predicted dehydrogenase